MTKLNSNVRDLQPIVAAVKNISSAYFTVPRFGLSPAKRERVYCYELYHQMRLVEGFGDFTLHGEIDKRGDPSFENKNPDYVIHHPGCGAKGDNFIVIEVKLDDAEAGIVKDLNKLKCMITEHGYKYGVFILVGHDMDWFKKELQEAITHFENANNEKQLFIICHESEGNARIESLYNLRRCAKA